MIIQGKNLKNWGVPPGPVYGILLAFINDCGISHKRLKTIIKDVVANPSKYVDDPLWGKTAEALIPEPSNKWALVGACPLNIFGAHLIEQGALEQICVASCLPVSVRAACMPDGHQGYGLPIGGVLATRDAVIPYAVGVDIGCRMHLTITDASFRSFKGERERVSNEVIRNTIFGIGNEGAPDKNHPILDDPRFKEISTISHLHSTAVAQIGSSGGGNHFVNVGYIVSEELGITEPRLAILSHSGSRGVGANIAKIYTDIAMAECELPKEAKHLAWLDINHDAGREYWQSMNLAGDFARANHEVLHARLVKALKVKSDIVIQNHHNFAWKETVTLPDGSVTEALVHRKGATPAGKGVRGIIPGSMTTPSYIVEGLGNVDSINSSSHGAGRKMSRSAAKDRLTMSAMRKDLAAQDVHLIGGSLDECSDAYKNIDEVMAEQTDVVRIIGTFTPWVVRMAEEGKKKW